MPLLSIEFAIFFICFFPIYWLLRLYPVWQNRLLLIAGLCWLYSLNPYFTISIFIFSFIIYIIAIYLSNQERSERRKVVLIVGIIFVVANLVFFKYVDFFKPLLSSYGIEIDIFIPLGLSYYSFQSIAYLVAVYKEKSIKLKWDNLLLHFSFFLTITSGPIIRVDRFKSIYGEQQGASIQINTSEPRNIIFPAGAIMLIILGIMKKWWFANSLATYVVDPIFQNPLQNDPISILTAIYGYTLQLFFDFSGYTDLAIGLAMLLGFRLPHNFAMPLLAHNIREFWNRWHITLSTWIRDYIYIPLGGNRKGFVRTQINLFLAMVISGIWHGSNWNFLLWGALHGIALVILNTSDNFFGKDRISSSRIGKIIAILITLHFVFFTFVIFRTSEISDALMIFQGLIPREEYDIKLSSIVLLTVFIVSLILYKLVAKLFDEFIVALDKIPTLLWVIPITLLMFVIIIFAPSGIPGFIYANF